MSRSVARACALLGALALAGCMSQQNPKPQTPAVALAPGPNPKEPPGPEPRGAPEPAAPMKVEQRAEFDIKASGRLSFTPDGSEVRVGFRHALDMRPGPDRGKELRNTPKPENQFDTYRALSSNDKLLASDRHLFDPAGKKLLDLVRTEKSRLSAVEFSPDGSLLAGGNVRYHETRSSDGYVYVWETAGGTVKTKLELKYPVEHLAFGADGKTLVAACGSQGHGEVHRYSVGTWQEIAPVASKDTGPDLLHLSSTPTGLAVAPVGERLAVMTSDKELIVFDAPGTVRITKNASDHVALAPLVLFSPDGTRLASHDNGTIYLWDPANLSTPPVKFERDNWLPRALAFSTNGKVLAAAGENSADEGSVRIFDLVSGKERTDVPAFPANSKVYGVAFHPKTGELAVSTSNGKLTLLAVPGAK
jgi:WD40 repeat protein